MRAEGLALLTLAAACSAPPPAGAGGSGGGSGGAQASSSSASSSSSSSGAGGSGGAIAPCNAGGAPVCNPFGLDLDLPGMDGATYWGVVDTAIAAPFYKPPPVVLATGGACDRCVEATMHGRRLVLEVRADGGPGQPTTPPEDLSIYQGLLGELLDAHEAAVAAVVIEGGAESAADWEGSVDAYLALLAAGCATAHARGVDCTNAGISSTSMVLLLADYFAAAGTPAAAINAITLAGDNPEIPPLFPSFPPAGAADLEAGLDAARPRIDRARALISGARGAGVDYVNFHWWERDQDSLDQAIALARNASDCNHVATTDLGQRTQDTFELLHKAGDAKELGMSLVIWSSRAEDGGAPMCDAGGALTENGEAYAGLVSIATCD